MNIAFSVISGILLVLAFPKFNLFYLAYIALVPLLFALRRAGSLKMAAVLGAVTGLIMMGGTLYWINILSKWAGSWAYLALASLSVFQAFFIAAFACVYWLGLRKFKGLGLAVAPLAWSAVEWIRSLGPYGVTGAGLSYSQSDFLPVLQLAALLGCYSITFLVVFINEALMEAIAGKKTRPLIIALAVFLPVLAFGYYRIGTFKETGRPIKVAVIQANIAQDIKLDFGFALEIVQTHEMLSKRSLEVRPDIIIWPETAVTTYLFESNMILPALKKVIKETKAYYLIGTPYRDGLKIYNSVAGFSRSAELIGRYDKQRLVPFGEYLPMRSIFYRMLQENPLFSEDYNSNQKPVLIDLGIAKAGVVICFESTFPYIVRDKVKRGAQFILVATNDAWFFDSAAIYQHVEAARMRAVENNIYVVQAANTGISAIIDPLGRVLKKSNEGETTILTGQIFVH